MRRIFYLTSLILCSCGVQHRFASAEEAAHDSSVIYTLPYPTGKSHLLLQGYNSRFSHRGRLGLDFVMHKGSVVTAAREGVVVRVEQGFTRGGINKKYLGKANQVIVRHSDGSQAYYGHLLHNGVLVHPGDTVHRGDTLALSGSTGYSALPHLHFIVWGPSPQGRRQLPTRFYTSKGVFYLKPGKKYKRKDNGPRTAVHGRVEE